MKEHIKFGFLISLHLLLIGCKADPNVLSDDDQPTLIFPTDSLICDSLFVPNSYFSNTIGEVLIFVDSMGTSFDTLVCAENEAWSEVSDLGNSSQVCSEHYRTAFTTNWLPKPDLYAVEFSISKSLISRHSAQSILQSDFSSTFTDAGGQLENRYNSFIINNKTFLDVDLYNCNTGNNCAFVESFALAKTVGLVAFKRDGIWWTKR